MSKASQVSPTSFDPSLAVRTFLAPLQPFLENPDITELALMRPCVFFARRHGGWKQHHCTTLSAQHLTALINAITVFNGLTPAPLLVARLPDGQRCQIAQPPACLNGEVAISIRQPARQAPSLEQWQAGDALAKQKSVYKDAYKNKHKNAHATAPSAAQPSSLSLADLSLQQCLTQGDWVNFLHEAVQQGRNIVVAGATGSGKTTLARALIAHVPRQQRLITLEDVHELSLPDHPNHVHLLYGTDSNRVSASDCLRACLRLSPERIFLTELRGPETWDYLAALNTGHPGSITTTHANSAADVMNRLAMLIKQSDAGSRLDWQTIERFLRQTVEVVVFLKQCRLQEIWFEPKQRRTQQSTPLSG